jgi:tripartite-type tricarboxylate transporter receptor subunit TctC
MNAMGSSNHLSALITDRLNEEINGVLNDPEAIEKFRSLAKHVPEKQPLTGDVFRKLVINEYNSWGQIAERENVVVQQVAD